MILFDDGMAISEDFIKQILWNNGESLCIVTPAYSHYMDVDDYQFARDWLIAILDEHQQAEPMAIIGRLADILERTLDKLDDAEDIIGALAHDGVQVGHA